MNFNAEFLQRNQSGEMWQQTDHSWPSSSSSSLLSRSIDSPECSSLLYNGSITCEPDNLIEIPANYNNKITRPLTSSINRPHPLSMQSYSQQGSVCKIRLPAPDKDDEAVTKAMLAVISSAPTSFSSYNPTQSYSRPHQPERRNRTGAFKPYNSALGHVIDTRSTSTFRGQSTMKHVMAFLRRLSSMKVNPLVHQENRLLTAKQLNHVMSERKRRGSVVVLRPPITSTWLQRQEARSTTFRGGKATAGKWRASKVKSMAKDGGKSSSGSSGLETAAVIGGLVATPVIGWSLYTLKTTGCGLPPGPGGSVGALEGVSYLVVVAIIGWSLYTKLKTGSGLPNGPFGLLGAVEGLSYLAFLSILLVFGLQFLDKGFIPGPLPGEECFG